MAFTRPTYNNTQEYWPVRPPTAKQYAYAWKISYALQIALPDTLDITEFSKFIEHYKDKFGEVVELNYEAKQQAIIEDNIRNAAKIKEEFFN